MSKWFVQVTRGQLPLPLKDIEILSVLWEVCPIWKSKKHSNSTRRINYININHHKPACPGSTNIPGGPNPDHQPLKWVAPLHQKVAKANPWRLQPKMAASFHEKLELLQFQETEESICEGIEGFLRLTCCQLAIRRFTISDIIHWSGSPVTAEANTKLGMPSWTHVWWCVSNLDTFDLGH